MDEEHDADDVDADADIVELAEAATLPHLFVPLSAPVPPSGSREETESVAGPGLCCESSSGHVRSGLDGPRAALGCELLMLSEVPSGRIMSQLSRGTMCFTLCFLSEEAQMIMSDSKIQ